MKSSEGQTARLRTRYTGEPVAAALTFFRHHGLHFGLVPDATDRRQRQLEAVLLRTLARPHPGLPPLAARAGTAYGLTGVSPGVDRLLLWPAPDQLPQLLARLLPTRTAAGQVGGVPGLRAHPLPSRRSDTLTLARAGSLAHVEMRTHPTALDHARALATAAGLEPLWESDASSQQEQRAWTHALTDTESPEDELWSTALRRLGLAITSPPDWEHRPPAATELEGPNPKRIAARASGPRAQSVHGAVAVIAADGRGGNGCTTTAYVLATALAYSGARVAVLERDETNGLPMLLGRTPAPAGHWQDIGDHLPGSGSLQMATLPRDTSAAERLIAEARDAFDSVVIDAGGAFQQRHLAAQADTVLALLSSETQWYDTETIDHRPDKPRLWDWLEDRFQEHLAQQNLAEAQRLHNHLDLMFEVYVKDRQEGESDVYDAADDEDIDAWWLGYDDRLNHDRDAETQLPEELQAPHLQRWRADYISFLSEEGARRHPDTWPEIVAAWAERNRNRNLDRLAPLEPSDDEVTATVARFRTAIEAEALATWGEELWSREWPLWVAADEEEEERVRAEYADLIEVLRHPRPAEQVAHDLLRHFQNLPNRPVVAALNRVREDVDQHHLADITEVLRGQGFTGLAVIPKRTTMQSWVGGSGPLHPQALAIGWHLASQLAETPGERK
jgi:hypothetical protein